MNKLKLLMALAIGILGVDAFGQTTVSFSIANPCIGEPTVLTSTSTSTDIIVDYKWDVDNDGLFDEYEGPSTVTPVFPFSQNWQVGLRVYTDQGDSATAYQTVVITNVPEAGFATDETCINEEVTFTNQSTLSGGSINRIIWEFGDGTSQEMVGDVSKKYAHGVTYEVTQIVESDALCRDTLSKSITLGGAPTASIVSNADITEIATSQTLELSLSETVNSFTWSTGETTESITIDTPGWYSVQGTDLSGCNFNDTIQITQFSNKDAVYNAFSPNGDGQNDYWKIRNIELYQSVSVRVFDRRGGLVYEEENYQNDWSGDYNGQQLPEGVYYYHVTFNGDDENTLRGTLTVLSAQ